jgi:hypothetical protein
VDNLYLYAVDAIYSPACRGEKGSSSQHRASGSQRSGVARAFDRGFSLPTHSHQENNGSTKIVHIPVLGPTVLALGRQIGSKYSS